MKLIFLHGVGQTSSAWDKVVSDLSAYDYICFDLLEDGHLPAFSALQERVRQAIRQVNDEVVLVGLSLGGMLALSMLEKPEPNLVGIISIAGQYQFVGNWAYKLQVGLIKLLPASVFAKQGLHKTDLVAFYQELKGLDMTPFLMSNQLPALLLCGTKDKINFKVAKTLQGLLPNAQLAEISDAGHEVNKEQPQLLAHQIDGFVRKIMQSK